MVQQEVWEAREEKIQNKSLMQTNAMYFWEQENAAQNYDPGLFVMVRTSQNRLWMVLGKASHLLVCSLLRKDNSPDRTQDTAFGYKA